MGGNEVEDLILNIGSEMGRGEEEMRKYVEIIVNRNWYDKVELLKGITPDQWKAMNIPLRLVGMIKERISSGERSPEAGEDSKETKEQQVLRETDTWEYEYFTPEHLETRTPSLYNSVESLGSISREKLKEVTDLLFKIIDSIIKEPRKGRIRRIRMGNPKFASTVGAFSEALNVLWSVGFVQVRLRPSQISGSLAEFGIHGEQDDQEEYIELPVAYISRLMDCHHLLEILCEKNKIDHPRLVSCDFPALSGASGESSAGISHFNPYVPSISSTSASSNSEASRKLIRSAIEERRQMESEIKKREREIEGGVVSSNELGRPPQEDLSTAVCSRPFAIHSSNIHKLDSLIKTINDTGTQGYHHLDDDDDDAVSHLGQSELQRIKDSVLGKAQSFKSRTNEYLKSLLSRKVHSHSSIRVVFPDKYILQLQFKPNNTTYDLIQSVRDCINPNISSMNWYIYQSPPISKVVPDKNITLLKAGFVPNAQLYFKLELPPNHILKGNYIKAQLINEKESF